MNSAQCAAPRCLVTYSGRARTGYTARKMVMDVNCVKAASRQLLVAGANGHRGGEDGGT